MRQNHLNFWTLSMQLRHQATVRSLGVLGTHESLHTTPTTRHHHLLLFLEVTENTFNVKNMHLNFTSSAQ